MKRKAPARAAALLLALTLVLAPAAQAISVEEARTLLRENYIEEISQEILDLPTIDAITGALGDPYTYYMTAEEYAAMYDSLSGADVVGIGVMVEQRADGLLITSVAPNAPAAGAGLRFGDLIVAVDGTTIQAAGSPDALTALVAGEEGTSVSITVLRDGEKLTRTMTRSAVSFPSVTGEVVDGHIGWITYNSFGDGSSDYLEEYILAEDPDADRWVMDLRGNGGGYSDEIVSAVGHVVGSCNVAYLANRQGELEVWQSGTGTLADFLSEGAGGLVQEPLVVLVDGSTASAAELFASNIRDYQKGLLIGARTFGKGIAQSLFTFDDGSVFRITTERYYSPAYVTPDRSGVLPHLVVDANLADEAALLLCGAPAETPSADVLVLELAGQSWYVHQEEALDGAYAPAFAELLAALPPGVPMTLNGQTVTPEEAARAWGVDLASRWFGDITGSPYEAEINTLASLGLVFGDETGAFRPQEALTRAELAAFLAQAMGLWYWESQGVAPLTDLEEADWYAVSASALYYLGLVKGDENGAFRPDDLVDNQQFLTILTRLAAHADLTVQWYLERLAPEDLERAASLGFESWACASAAGADGLGFLTVPLEALEPGGAVTREEAAAMLCRFLVYSGILPPTASF